MELTEQQKKVVCWQWIILGCCLAFIIMVQIGEYFVPEMGRKPLISLILVSQFGVAGLSGLIIGILSVVYRVTILGERVAFWKPVGGADAIFYGSLGIFFGVFMLGMAIWEGLPFFQLLHISPWLCGGIILGTMALVFIYRGLRRALEA